MRLGTIEGSSLVKKVGFQGEAGSISTMRIELRNATIDFFKVPYRVFRGLVKSKDPGRYYLDHIYGKFDYKVVEEK